MTKEVVAELLEAALAFQSYVSNQLEYLACADT